MRITFLASSSLLAVVAFCNCARADIFEVPLPITGTYDVDDRRTFEVDFATAFSEIREGRFKLEGTMVAPLRGEFSAPRFPTDAFFRVSLDHPTQTVTARGPSVGSDTYPAPEPFAGESTFSNSEPAPVDWAFLLDGRLSGTVTMTHDRVCCNDVVVGGTGIITSAALILDATPIPEPGHCLGFLTACALARRSRRSSSK